MYAHTLHHKSHFADTDKPLFENMNVNWKLNNKMNKISESEISFLDCKFSFSINDNDSVLRQRIT